MAKGINTTAGHVTYQAVADAYGYAYKDIYSLLNVEKVVVKKTYKNRPSRPFLSRGRAIFSRCTG